MDKKFELNDKELKEVNGGIAIPGLEAIGPFVASADPQRDLDIGPSGSGTGTTPENNILPPEVAPRT